MLRRVRRVLAPGPCDQWCSEGSGHHNRDPELRGGGGDFPSAAPLRRFGGSLSQIEDGSGLARCSMCSTIKQAVGRPMRGRADPLGRPVAVGRTQAKIRS